LGSRFIDTDSLGQALGRPLDEEQVSIASEKLENVWKLLFERPQLRPHVRANRVRALRKAFKDYALLYRCAQLPTSNEVGTEPCTIEALKNRFPSSFMASSEKTLWYTRLPLFRDPIAKSHWCLVDRQYLNCTFKKPGMRLMMYARANELPPGFLRQKSAAEEVYDRVILKQSLNHDEVLRQLQQHHAHDLSQRRRPIQETGVRLRQGWDHPHFWKAGDPPLAPGKSALARGFGVGCF